MLATISTGDRRTPSLFPGTPSSRQDVRPRVPGACVLPAPVTRQCAEVEMNDDRQAYRRLSKPRCTARIHRAGAAALVRPDVDTASFVDHAGCRDHPDERWSPHES